MDLAFDLLELLLQTPTDISIETAFMLWCICGYKMSKKNKKKVNMFKKMMKNMSRDKRIDNQVKFCFFVYNSILTIVFI